MKSQAAALHAELQASEAEASKLVSEAALRKHQARGDEQALGDDQAMGARQAKGRSCQAATPVSVGLKKK
jgi:hypothetical protein